MKKLKPIKGKPLTFTASGLKIINSIDIILEPFFRIHDSRYMMYWMALSTAQYRSYLDSVSALEKEKLALQKRTIDFVAPGEQQPEADHFIQSSQSRSGNFLDEFWRDAGNNGYFSYQLSTQGKTDLSLIVRYWGAEEGNRKFDIYIDDQKLLTEDIARKWNQSRFQNVEYKIPDSIIKNKNAVRVKFQSLPGNTAGPVYYAAVPPARMGHQYTGYYHALLFSRPVAVPEQ